MLVQATNEQPALLRGEKFGRLGPIDNEKLRDGRADDRCKAFDYEYPSPAAIASDAVHIRQSIRQKLIKLERRISRVRGSTYTAKGSGEYAHAKEEVESPLKLVGFVVHRNEVGTALHTSACIGCSSRTVDPYQERSLLRIIQEKPCKQPGPRSFESALGRQWRYLRMR